jgi:hypothetical protein
LEEEILAWEKVHLESEVVVLLLSWVACLLPVVFSPKQIEVCLHEIV